MRMGLVGLSTAATRLWRGGVMVAGAAALALVGCGDDGGGGDSGGATDPPDVRLPASIVTTQQGLTEAEWQAEVDGDPELAAVAQGLTLATRGVVEDSDGTRVVWAETIDGATTALRHCASDGDCVHVTQTRTGNTLNWTDAGGASVPLRTVGRPVLLKDLGGFDLTSPTTLPAGLQIDKGALPDVDLASREFVMLNTFGEAFGTTMAPLAEAVEAIGGYDEVREQQYAREFHVTQALAHMDRHDTLVWFTQGIRQETKGGWEASRTVGFTVNRGGFGDATMDRNAIEAAFEQNVADGPGIVFLAGSNSYGDGTAGQPDSAAVWRKFVDPDNPVRHQIIVIGFEGHSDAQRILAATVRFFETYLTGQLTLQESIDAANDVLAGTAARLVSNAWDDIERGRKHLRSYDDVWAGAPGGLTGPPSAARATLPMTSTLKCGNVGGPYDFAGEDFATAWADVTFDGSYFEGSRQFASSEINVDTNIRGVLGGFEVDDRVLYEAWGNMDKPQFQDFHAYGEGRVTAVEETDDGKIRVRFTGEVHSSFFTNDLGQECFQVTPTIATTAGDPATLELTP